MSETDTLSNFGTKFQAKAIAAVLSDKLFLDQIHDIIDPKHFESNSHSWIIDRILWYFHEYKSIPTLEVFKREIDKLPSDNVETKNIIVSTLKEIVSEKESDDLQYVKDQYLEFCKNQTLKTAILKSADKLSTRDYDGIKVLIDKAMRAGEERNYGHDWIEDVESRLSEETRITITTGWSIIDELMDGGLGAGELGVVMATAGAGKSWALSAIGKAAIENGKSVLTFSMELNEKYMGNRYDSLFTGIEPRDLKKNLSYVREVVNSVPGKMKIKFYPARTATVNTLTAYLNKLQISGFVPDLIIIDYADLMRPSVSGHNRYEDIGTVYEELRGMAGEFNVPIWTASQAHRAAVNSDVLEADKIAESFQKVMIADFIMSISRKSQDKVNKAARIHIIKNRFGADGSTFHGHLDFSAGIVDIFHPDSAEAKNISESLKEHASDVKRNLLEQFGRFKQDNNLG